LLKLNHMCLFYSQHVRNLPCPHGLSLPFLFVGL
jgi:hypothetical protein